MKQLLRAISLALVLGLSLGGAIGCTPAAQRKTLISFNDAQDAAAHTYDDAKARETAAEVSCRQALVLASKPVPAKPADIGPMCAAVGVTMPFDPVALQKAAGPINALYDGVRTAQAQRLAAGGDVAPAVISGIAQLFVEAIADLEGAGISVPQKVKDVAGQLNAAAGGK